MRTTTGAMTAIAQLGGNGTTPGAVLGFRDCYEKLRTSACTEQVMSVLEPLMDGPPDTAVLPVRARRPVVALTVTAGHGRQR